MAQTKYINTRIQTKRDTAANWESKNPVLLNGEIIIVDTSNGEVRFKIGNGSKTYTQLPFEDETVRNLIAGKADISTVPTTYAGSSSAGGAATSANKLNINAGGVTQPIYFSNGVPVKTTYTLGKSVPSDAKFTDTDTKVTSVENHYTPDEQPTHAITLGTNTTDTMVVTGIGIDAAGHAVSLISSTIPRASSSLSGLMSSSDKTKLDSLISGAEVNQNAFANIKVGSTTIAADTKQDTFTLTAGTNITLTPDATNDGVTITAKDTTYSAATTSAAGLMSASDKSKLDGIASGANAYSLPAAGSSLGGVKTGGDVTISAGVITVNDDSHAHVISNVDGLQTALDAKLATSLKGAASGLAELDSNGKVPTAQLPSYVDDVLEYATKSAFPSTGESGKIYIDQSTNITYRWSGSAYVEISASLALGETESTAYRGDRGKTAYDHASAKGSAFSSGLYKITTNAQGHVTAATAVTKTDITNLGIPAQDTVYTLSIANATTLGGVKPVTKTDNMLNEVGIDTAGKLWTSISSPIAEVDADGVLYFTTTQVINGDEVAY